MFQTSTTNQSTLVNAIPNGTNALAEFRVFNNSDPTNASSARILVTASEATIRSDISGTGTYLPLTMYTGGSERLRIDTSGNVGIGTSSPSYKLQVSSTAASAGITSTTAGQPPFLILNNTADSSNSYIYCPNKTLGIVQADTSASSIVYFSTQNAERMRIDSSGNVGIGTASPSSKFDVVGGRSTFSANSENFAVYLRYNNSTNGFYIGSPSADAMVFNASSGAERMRIDSSGNLLVGTTSSIIAGSRMSISGDNGVGTGSLSFVNTGASTKKWVIGPDGSGNYVNFNDAGAGTYILYGGTSWTSSSDERLKTDLVPIPDAVNKVSTLRAVTGRFKTDAEGTSRSFLIAQDVQKVLPEAVSEFNGNLGVQYTEVIPLLVAAIQEQQAMIETLTTRLNALEGK